MLEKIIDFSIKNKLIVVLFTLTIIGFGLYAIYKIPVGTVPDITNNQVQVITTSSNLSTQEIEQFITAPVEMEMANLPGVVEMRSISKFGISLVTVVFEDNMGTFLPRQLIEEKIKSASGSIPEEYGTPEMGPVSTGLGEIYQYILDVKPGYEDNYTPMDLRTIQDWIVKRRLSGIKGVVEVNSWGGYLKQYEVAVDPLLLKSLNIDLLEVYDALEKNNSISGAAYIEKTNQAYFIRGDGQIKDIGDIENVLIKNNEGTPVLISDVAKVHFGFANRFGAITANGKGETILGQIMMLKDANSKEVIKAVHDRVEGIQDNLPEGVFINPILERGELIAKTSHTVIENLILGALIVFITVLLILGNLRSALVIASMIPLALLFTISMMYVFGIDANLMSLGALDFGIIIDGAVIIVEYILLRMNFLKDKLNNSNPDERHLIANEIAFDGSSKMMKSAIFGQVIILIVFIPILSLRGVEGKMFHPMALAFSFAIIGAMIMGLTWLPVASSLFLKPEDKSKKNISDWLMNLVLKSYTPVIKWSCRHKRIVLGLSVLSLIGTGILFSKIGGEFVPTLDEGDFVIQPALKTGTSLSKTVEMTTKMENILIDGFPDEVDQIVCRIGAAEVPTDPMSMEEIDMIIKLNPKDEWTKAKDKEQLAEKFKNALMIIPGVEYEFTQPIEMRFNELITGVRSDIAVKIFGEDLDYINKKALEIKNLISDIPGAGDVILEKTSGLPQVKVQYNRNKIAHYGIDIQNLNTYLSSAFGGATAGVVFEGEKRFDLVLRYQDDNRKDIENIRNLMITMENGRQIPLSEFATIEYAKGPAKISRDNTRRRVVVSVNVRNRDLQSVVQDIQHMVDENVVLSPGNYIEYGGQFENLQNASKRLLIAVPVALLLIFIFLHFAFQSFKDAVMIFTAIPLATVGGVVLLWLRNMPFSVSAGVGFIALFGIAVLNGIVLIEHLKELINSGRTDIRKIIVQGAQDRLRPVLLTAGAAAMGFFPMAISTGAGAEVQRPLATVVIGGLVTSTMLTLVALPLLFEIFYNIVGVRFFPLRFIRSKKYMLMVVLSSTIAFNGFGQEQETTLDELILMTVENNKQIQASKLEIAKTEALRKASFAPGKTSVSYGLDENNIAENGYPLKVWSVEQVFDFPGKYIADKRVKQLEVEIAKTELKIVENLVIKELTQAYFEHKQLSQQIEIYRNLDSIYSELLKFTHRRYELNDVKKLDYLNIKAKQEKSRIALNSLLSQRLNLENKIKILTGSSTDVLIPSSIEILPKADVNLDSLPNIVLLQLKNELTLLQSKVAKNSALPGLSLNYFLGSNTHGNAQLYHGFEVGLDIPLFYRSYKKEIDAAKISNNIQVLTGEDIKGKINIELKRLTEEQEKLSDFLIVYEESGKFLVEEIKRTAIKAYQLKEISFTEFAMSLEGASDIETEYYSIVFEYNKTNMEITYF